MTKWKGQAASFAPNVAEIVSLISTRALPLSIASVLAVGTATAAVDRYWDPNGTSVGRGGTGTWNATSSFWSPSGDGVSGPYSMWNNGTLDTAIFGGTAGTVTLGSTITVGGVTFETNGYVLNGSTLTLGGVTPTITTNTSVTATISSIIAGTAGFTKNGAGTLALNGANTFTGNVILAAGSLSVGSDAALGAASNRVVTSGGAALLASGDLASNRVVELTGGVTSIGGAGVGSALFTGAGGLRIVQDVVLNNDANDFTGQASFSVNGAAYFTSVGNVGEASSLGAGGTIRFTATNQYQDWLYYIGSGNSSNRNWEFATSGGTSGSVFVNNGTGTLTLTGNIAAIGATGTGMSFMASKADLELLGVISSPANRNFVFRGGGVERTITLGNANTYVGATGIGSGGAVTVRAGSLADTGVVSSFGTGTAGGIEIYSDSVLSYTGSGSSSNRAWTIGPAVVTGGMGGTISNDGTGALALSGAVELAGGANGGLRLGGSYTGVNTLSGVISGNGTLGSRGSGTWLLTGANTRTGAIAVDGGTLRAGSAAAFGTTTGITVNGGTLDLNSFDLAASTLAGTGGVVELGSATLSLGSATSTAFAGSISGSGGLTKTGSGVLTLSGANTYSGDTTLNGGGLTLDFSQSGAPASNIISATSTLNLAGSSVRIVGGAGAANSQTFDGLNISAGSNRIVATTGAGGSVTVNLGAVNRTGGLVDFAIPSGAIFTTSSLALGGWATVNNSDYAKVDGGVITAFEETDYVHEDNAANWQNGNIISDTTGFYGTVGASRQLGGLRYTQPVATTVTIASGQTLGTDGTIIVAPSVLNNNQLIAGGALTGSLGGGVLGLQQNSAGNFTIASTITDNGGAIGFTKGGNGLATLTGANTYTGATTLSGGILAINTVANGGQASSLGKSSAASSNLVLESGTLRYTGANGSTDRGFTLVNGGPSRTIDIVNGAANVVFSGLVTSPDDSGFTKTGSGTLTLANGANDYVGVTTVNGGVLAVTTLTDGGLVSSIGMSSSDAANLVLAGGTLNYLGATTISNRGLTLGTGSGGIGVNEAGSTLTLSGTVIGSGGLRKEGAGTLVLTGANTYAGDTVVNTGTLQAGSAQAFGSPSGFMTVNNGAKLELGGYNVTVAGLLGGGTVNLGNNTLTSSGGSAHGFTGKITGTGGFTRTGDWTQTLSGCSNDYTGKTTISGGSALAVDCIANGGVASGIGASSNASANLVFNNGTLGYSGGTVTTNRGFTLQGGVGAIGVMNAATTLTFTGQVVGAGTLRKDGAGTLVLSGANTYTGATQINGGILRANSSSAFGAPAAMILANVAGAELDLNGFDTSVTDLQQGGALGGNITLGGADLTIATGNNSATSYFAGAINSTGSLIKNGAATQRLTGCSSSYTGSTTINGGVLAVACLTDGGTASSIGISSAAASNLVINGGTLRYIGTGGSTDRRFTLGASGGNALDASGTGAINFTSNAPATFAAANTAQTLTLTGTNTGDNKLATRLTNNGTGVTSLAKTGTGTWILTNPASTYTGVTTISGGVLGVDKLANGGLASSLGASSAAASNLIIGNGSTLRYTGAGDTTNRLFTLSAGVTFIESSGTGAIVFTDTGPVTLAGANQNRTIALGGTNTGNNTLAGSIGDAGTGKTILAKNDSGTWVLTGNNTFTGNTVVNAGTLVLGNGGTKGSVVSDVIVAGGALAFNRSDSYSYGGLISGAGGISQIGSGTTILTGNNSYTGATNVNSGTLLVNGNQSAANGVTTVRASATLGGTGIVGGNVVVAGGTLAPGSNGAGTLTINGNLSLDAASTLAMQFGQASTVGGALNDLIDVKGNLTLDGTLNVSATVGGTFGPGIYRIISYTGTLTDHGLDIGALPSGTGVIQTSVAGQVNLLAGGNSFSFWDGDAGPKFNGAVNGGNGTWQNGTGNDNWTDSSGVLNAAYSDGTYAIFAGAAGTVTVDNGLGQVTAEGMQFATNGYRIQGGVLQLVGPQSTIRVGDGTGAGAGMTATIDSVLAGNTQLVKTDAGTLVLTGSNTYTGGTAINGGTVRIASDANLGAAAGGLSFGGGTLNTTANITTGRAVTLAGAGTLLTDAGTTLTLSGAMTGIGALTKSGTGTLLLTGNATHSGGTTIAAGTLQIGNGGTTGSIAGNIVNNGALIFNRSNALLYAGSVSGTGTLTQNGTGTTTMTGTSTYTGTTSVDAGKLVLQSGGQINGTSNFNVATVAGVSAEAVVDGPGSRIVAGLGISSVGNSGTGTLTVQNGGSASFGTLVVGANAGSDGTLSIVGQNSLVITTGGATQAIGFGGTATLNILDGGKMVAGGSDGIKVGVSADSTGTITVSGARSQWDVTAALDARRGSVTVSNGGLVTAGSASFAGVANGLADLIVTGAGSRFETTGALTIASNATATGSVTITDGGVVEVGTLAMGAGNAVLNIGGAEGSAAAHAGKLEAAAVTMAAAGNRINFNHDDSNYEFEAAISGAGFVNHNGPGATVLSGASSYAGATTINAGSLYINGDQSAAQGLTTVNSSGTLGGIGIIGGDVLIANGAAINPGGPGVAPATLTINGNLSLASGSKLNYSFGQANVAGGPLNDLIDVGGNLVLDGTLDVATSGGGSFDPGVYRVINYAGTLTGNGLTIGTIPSPDFYLQTSVDHQVNLVNTGGLTLRYWDGAAMANKNNDTIDGGSGIWQNVAGNDNWTEDTGAANAPFQDAAFAVFMGASGTVTVDNGLGSVNAAGMQFVTDGYVIDGGGINLAGAPSSVIRVGDGTTGGAGITATIASVLGGATQLVKSDLGTLVLTGNNTYTGGTAVKGGTLLVNGDHTAAGGPTEVAGGTLGGTGIIGGDVIVAGGTIAPGSNGVGTLTIKGNMTLGAGSTLAMEFGEADAVGGALNDLIDVDGDLVLDGTLHVSESAGGGFGAGIYRVINYGGTLTDNGLNLGTMPVGSKAVVQTSVSGQVNLINTGGLYLSFWDGAAGPKFDGVVSGGDGVWQNSSGNDNWTDGAGALNAQYDDGGYAVFAGTAGTVTIDNGLGQITASGMQIASNGYLITGGTLDLVGPQAVIRVGDGTTAGSAIVATIASELSGASQLVKTDLGTLVLTGNNSYTGGTAINGGTLEIAADVNLGAAAGDVSFDGGILHTTADLDSDRSVTLAGNGTIATDAGTTFTLNGLLSGTGVLTKGGVGTLLLTGDSSAYLATSKVAGGTLAVNGILGGKVNVASGGRLEGDGHVGGVTNAGVVGAGHEGIGTLTIDGDYVGSGGFLEIETTLGGDASPTDLLVVNGATSGSTTVNVINRNGLGAQTLNGIKIIDITGVSNGTFTLKGDYLFEGDQAVVAGAFGYRLYKNGIADPVDGDWYLRSSLLDPSGPGELYQPGVPIYESYAGLLQQLNKLGTLQQRVGNRAWGTRTDGARLTTEGQTAADSNGIWARIEAAHAEFEPEVSTSGADYDATTWKLQTGIDGLLMETEAGRLIGGLYAQYGTASSSVWSRFGVGGIDSTGVGLGATLTWYGENGFYLDGQAQVTWYDSDLQSATAGRSLVEGNDGVGYGLSIEAGRRIALSGNWSLTPQAQLAYSSVRFDDFTDTFGADVSLGSSRSLVARLGIAANHDVEWRDGDGRINRAQLYGIANLYYDLLGRSEIDVAGMAFASRDDRLRGGLGVGGSYNWAGDKYSVYGEAHVNTSLENIGGSNAIGGTVGFRMSW